jgi:hypothetical protein
MKTPEQHVIEDNYLWFGFYAIVLFIMSIAVCFTHYPFFEKVIAWCVLLPCLLGNSIMAYRNWRSLQNNEEK